MAFSPMRDLEQAIAGAASRAAPEKTEALEAQVTGNIRLQFVYEPHSQAGPFKFGANPETKVISLSQGALELLWAASFAFKTLFETCRDSRRAGVDRVNAADFPEFQNAFRLYGWALNKCHREECEPWPEGYARPFQSLTSRSGVLAGHASLIH